MSEKQRGINIIVVGTGSNSVRQLIEVAENNKEHVLVVDNSKEYTIKAPSEFTQIPELILRDNPLKPIISKRAERRKNKRKNK